MNEQKLTAQKAIEEATLTIGQDGNKNFAFALSQVEDHEDHALVAIAMAGEPQVMVNSFVAAMFNDADFKHVVLSAANQYMVSKFFNRRPKQCDCPDCLISRAMKGK